MNKILILIPITALLFSCEFLNPVDGNNHTIIETGGTLGTPGEEPTPGLDGFIITDQRPGLTAFEFYETLEEQNHNEYTRYRGLLNLLMPLDSNARFSAGWDLGSSIPLFTDNPDDGLNYYEYALYHDNREKTYAGMFHHDSNVSKYMNVQAISGNGYSIYQNKKLANVPLFGQASVYGGWGDDVPTGNDVYESKRCAIAHDSQENYYIAFQFSAGISVPGGPWIETFGGNDIVLAKYSKDNQFIWSRHIRSAGDDQVSDLFISEKDQIYISGMFLDNHTPGVEDPMLIESSGTTEQIWHTNRAREEAYIIQYDTGGTVKTKYFFESPTATAEIGRVYMKKVVEDYNGDRYLIGLAMNSFEPVLPWNYANSGLRIDNVDQESGEPSDYQDHRWFVYVIKETSDHKFIGYTTFGYVLSTIADPNESWKIQKASITVSDALLTWSGSLCITGRFHGDIYYPTTAINAVDLTSLTYTDGDVNMYVLNLEQDLQPMGMARIFGTNVQDKLFLENSPNGSILAIGSGSDVIAVEGSGSATFTTTARKNLFVIAMSAYDLYTENTWISFINNGMLDFGLGDTYMDEYNILYVAGRIANITPLPETSTPFGLGSTYSQNVYYTEPSSNAFLAAYALAWDFDNNILITNEPHVRVIPGASSGDMTYADSVSVGRDRIILGGTFENSLLPGAAFPNPSGETLSGRLYNDIFTVSMLIGAYDFVEP